MIFLLLYLRSIMVPVDGCLSLQQSCTSTGSASCVPPTYAMAHDAMVSQYVAAPPQNNFLGPGVKARAYSETHGSLEFAKTDSDLHCLSALQCSWRNVEEDNFDWVVGEGTVDHEKISMITGSTILPGTIDGTFFILASDPRPPSQDGQLVSVAIGCQQSTGILTFRFWRSVARTFGAEPQLDICTRKALEVTLENCMTVIPAENHTIVASIPPIFEPFMLVIRGYNFQNTPEGGLIIIDQIEYFAHLDNPENCAPKPIDTTEIETIKSETGIDGATQVVSGDIGSEESSVLSRDVAQAAPTKLLDNQTSSELILLDNNVTDDTCRNLQCLVEGIDGQCDYKRSGYGASGEGYLVGWRISSIHYNRANKLTGVHVAPKMDDRANFLVADFEGIKPDEVQRVEDRYVLEAPEFSISDVPTGYLTFKKYLATSGVLLSVCEDGFAHKCFWNVRENSTKPFERSWTKEVVLLPASLEKFFIVAWQNLTEKVNYGQVGLAEIALYTDPEGMTPLC